MNADYEGVRVTFMAYLKRPPIPIQIDIGSGETIAPVPVETQYPKLLLALIPAEAKQICGLQMIRRFL